MIRFLLPILMAGILLPGCRVDDTEEEGGGGSLTSVDLFHGYYDVEPGYHFRLKFSARAGDTLHFEARVQDGDGDISYAFWTDSVNYAKWLGGDSAAVLRGYVEGVSIVSYSPALDSSVYYVVLGNSSVLSTKRFWVRAYLRGLR